jgi:hypothetical protein
MNILSSKIGLKISGLIFLAYGVVSFLLSSTLWKSAVLKPYSFWFNPFVNIVSKVATEYHITNYAVSAFSIILFPMAMIVVGVCLIKW